MTMLNGEPVDVPSISTAPITAAPPTASTQSQSVGTIVGIMSLIFAFAIPVVGAVLGGIAVAQARAGGYRNPLGMAGLVMGIVFTVIIAAAIVLGIVFGVGLFGGLIDLCQQLGPGTHRNDGVLITCT